MADYIIMCRDSAELTGLQWVQSLASQGYWGLGGVGPASSMKPGDRAIFYWTTKRLLVATCTIQGPALLITGSVPAPLLANSRYQFQLSDLVIWDQPLPYARVKAAEIRIPFLPSSVFPLKPGQFEALQALANDVASTVEPDQPKPREWDAEFTQAITSHNQKVRQELRQRLLAMDPSEFEELVGQLLVNLGFEGVEVTPHSGDGGIDVRGILVVAGSVRIRLAVQVKRWKNNVQAPVVQKVRGSLGVHEQGLIITTSGFSPGAREEAASPDKIPVGLVDGEQLVGLLIEHGIGVMRSEFVAFKLA